MSGSARSGVARDEEVADKGRRSFLRRGERQGKYNAEGTGCQCVFSGQFERTWKLLKGCGLPVRGCKNSNRKAALAPCKKKQVRKDSPFARNKRAKRKPPARDNAPAGNREMPEVRGKILRRPLIVQPTYGLTLRPPLVLECHGCTFRSVHTFSHLRRLGEHW